MQGEYFRAAAACSQALLSTSSGISTPVLSAHSKRNSFRSNAVRPDSAKRNPTAPVGCGTEDASALHDAVARVYRSTPGQAHRGPTPPPLDDVRFNGFDSVQGRDASPEAGMSPQSVSGYGTGGSGAGERPESALSAFCDTGTHQPTEQPPPRRTQFCRNQPPPSWSPAALPPECCVDDVATCIASQAPSHKPGCANSIPASGFGSLSSVSSGVKKDGPPSSSLPVRISSSRPIINCQESRYRRAGRPLLSQPPPLMPRPPAAQPLSFPLLASASACHSGLENVHGDCHKVAPSVEREGPPLWMRPFHAAQLAARRADGKPSSLAGAARRKSTGRPAPAICSKGKASGAPAQWQKPIKELVQYAAAAPYENEEPQIGWERLGWESPLSMVQLATSPR